MKEKLVNVGIFWAVPNKWEGGWSFYEVKKTYQLSDANSLGFIDYPYSHYEKWDDVRSASETDDCYYYPRGRVLYNVNTGKHRIFADECLDECDLWELIEMFEIEDFELCRDEHYVSVFTQKHKTAVTPMLEQAILIKGEKRMKKALENEFTNRVKTIKTAMNKAGLNLSDFPCESTYKLISRYSCAGKGERGKDNGTFSVINGIWQEFMVKGILHSSMEYFDSVHAINREKNIFKKSRSAGSIDDITSQHEEKQCRGFCQDSNDRFSGIRLRDYQVPVKSAKSDIGVGKIDLVGADNDEMVIVEYKIASSPEPLLRAVAEIVTYFHQIGGKNGATTYLEQFNKTFGLNCKKVGMAVAVPEIMYKAAHRYAFDLIQKYNIRCYSVDARSDDAPETIEIKRIDDEALKTYRKESEDNMKFVYDHSDDIMQALKNG